MALSQGLSSRMEDSYEQLIQKMRAISKYFPGPGLLGNHLGRTEVTLNSGLELSAARPLTQSSALGPASPPLFREDGDTPPSITRLKNKI